MDTHPTWAALLERAVSEPGVVSSAYSQFHQYSLGNQLLAWGQCLARGLQPGPLATFPRWKELARYVRRGERAIVLCRPVTIKRASDASEGADSGPEILVRFTYRPGWFVLAQTNGADVPAPEIPAWNAETALTALDIHQIPFDVLDGNVLGYARQRESRSTRSTRIRSRRSFTSWRTCSVDTRSKPSRPTPRLPRAPCERRRQSPSR
jgi:antirestriction factor ArdC-like protein